MKRLLQQLADWLLLPPARRYRVTPRENPFVVRRQLRRAIRQAWKLHASPGLRHGSSL